MKQIEFLKGDYHPKGWGGEIWLVNNDKYCGKLLKFDAGASFSDHYHVVKEETWFVLDGEFELWHYDLTNADRLVTKLGPGDVAHIPPSTPHQLTALRAGTIIEISTTHDETDSYRIGKGDSQKLT